MPKISTRPTPRELKPSEMALMFPLVNKHNPSVTRPIFTKRLKTMQTLGYRAIGIFEGKTLLACSGFWLRTRFWCGHELDIDNFIVREDLRGKKLGAAMLAWFEKFTLKNGINLMVLDTYADYFMAQRFYVRGGFAHTGFHMTKVPGSNKPFEKQKG